MRILPGHIDRERRTIGRMVELFCRDRHGGGPCAECAAFLDYAWRRLDKCPYGTAKPTCANCPVHCYKPAPRERAREIMRYAGPRMLLRHPLLAIAHQLDSLRSVRHPLELTREQRRRDTAGRRPGRRPAAP